MKFQSIADDIKLGRHLGIFDYVSPPRLTRGVENR
jgi:hypothetical protein